VGAIGGALVEPAREPFLVERLITEVRSQPLGVLVRRRAGRWAG
jgi:hypothetical protein